jgi:hypothetical protein
VYRPCDPKDGLSQGDVCRDIPVPLVGPGTKFGDSSSQQLIEGPPTPELMLRRSNLMIAFQLKKTPVLILSQSCDLEQCEREGRGRILLAPIEQQDDERFLSSFSKVKQQTADAFARKVAAASGGKDQGEVVTKHVGGLDKPRKTALTELWLGETIGAFPLAPHVDPPLPASLCYLDNVVSVPVNWAPLLRAHRILSLNEAWSNVLRESLQQWLSRYAYPGSNAERLRVGGLGEEEPPQGA